MKLVPAAALCGGVAVYLLGHVAIRLRGVGTLNRQRLVTAVIALALIPIATEVDALVALGLVTALMIGLVSYEALRFRERRAEVRATAQA